MSIKFQFVYIQTYRFISTLQSVCGIAHTEYRAANRLRFGNIRMRIVLLMAFDAHWADGAQNQYDIYTHKHF